MKRMKLLCAFLLQSVNIIFGYNPGNMSGPIQKPITSISGDSGTDGNSTTTDNQCPKCSSCNPTTNPIPSLQINLFDSTGTTPVNTATFITNSSITTANAMFIVQIFPPSNIITSTSVSSTSDDNSYAIMYTLKALDGSVIQKQLQYLTPKTPSTQEIDIMPMSKAPIIPISISLGQITPGATANDKSTITPLLTTTPLSFLPNLSGQKLSAQTQQRIFNGISPLSLKFYLNWDGTNLTATPISGMFDSSDDNTLTTSLIGSSSNIKTSTGSSLSEIDVKINSQKVATFNAVNIPFKQSDLAQGMALNIHIFPESTGSANPSYTVITTLRSLDGLKLRKVVSQGVAFNNQPSTFTINYGSNTILSSTFANTAMSSGNALNIISPINLRCLLHQNTASGTFMVSMV